MIRTVLFYLAVFIFTALFVSASDLDDVDFAHLNSPDQATIFVSLGSFCEVGHALRACGLRKEAFPFDWIISFNGDLLIEVLRDNFQHFLDDNYLVVGERGPGPLLNVYYQLEFLHDGDFRGELFQPTMQRFKAKYQKRIDRFRALSAYKGKVIFLRTANEYSTTDPHRYYFCKDNLEISDEYAYKLQAALSEFFPHLDFTLVLINNHPGTDVFIEKKLTDRLIKIRSNPGSDTVLK